MEQSPKIAVSAAADKDLEDMRKQINEGFASGKVTKSQLATWIITQFRCNLTIKLIERIRADHFDDVAHLENVVERLKEARKANAHITVQELLTPVLQRQKAAPMSTNRERAKDDLPPN